MQASCHPVDSVSAGRHTAVDTAVCRAEQRCPSLSASQELFAPKLPRQACSGTRSGRRASLLLCSLAYRLHPITTASGMFWLLNLCHVEFAPGRFRYESDRRLCQQCG
jgi:hypothetical protein